MRTGACARQGAVLAGADNQGVQQATKTVVCMEKEGCCGTAGAGAGAGAGAAAVRAVRSVAARRAAAHC